MSYRTSNVLGRLYGEKRNYWAIVGATEIREADAEGSHDTLCLDVDPSDARAMDKLCRLQFLLIALNYCRQWKLFSTDRPPNDDYGPCSTSEVIQVHACWLSFC